MVHKRLMVILTGPIVVGCAFLLSSVVAPSVHAESRTSPVALAFTTTGCPFLAYYAGYNGSKQERHTVALLQSRLNDWLAQPDKSDWIAHNSSSNVPPEALIVDGYFGPKTLVLVEAVQTKAFGSFDGLVGPHTWEALQGCDAPSSSLNGL